MTQLIGVLIIILVVFLYSQFHNIMFLAQFFCKNFFRTLCVITCSLFFFVSHFDVMKTAKIFSESLFKANTTHITKWSISSVERDMFGIRIKEKIFNSVIKLVSVNMMNVFFFIKFSMNMIFHNISMFWNFFTINKKPSISFLCYRTLTYRSILSFVSMRVAMPFISCIMSSTKAFSRKLFITPINGTKFGSRNYFYYNYFKYTRSFI